MLIISSIAAVRKLDLILLSRGKHPKDDKGQYCTAISSCLAETLGYEGGLNTIK
jgi:hypothetical protein